MHIILFLNFYSAIQFQKENKLSVHRLTPFELHRALFPNLLEKQIYHAK